MVVKYPQKFFNVDITIVNLKALYLTTVLKRLGKKEQSHHIYLFCW